MSGAPAANASLLLECQPELVTSVLTTDLVALEGATRAAEASTESLTVLRFEVPRVDCLVPPNPGRNGTLLHLARSAVYAKC